MIAAMKALQTCLRLSLYLPLFCLFTSGANAKVKVVEGSFESTPHQLVQEVTTQILAALETGLDPVNQPKEFVSELSVVLDPVIAFDYIAKGVMGVYAKYADSRQIQQFSTTFKLALVNTYGKGMSSFEDMSITILPPSEPVNEKRRVTVVQEIRNSSSVSRINYSMAKNHSGEWKMINIVLNGINLGETFRGQFAAAMKKNDGDLQKTIKEWYEI
ncbi:MAG: phospholipid transport system substrate-binding protein [Cellvibrionaceae bacterium]|jgi:phospholipid transport system substrate-binding protein